MSIDWPRFAEIVKKHQRFLLTSHIRPDCDALGSELGMAGVLEALGKSVSIVNGQANPQNLLFIDPEKRIKALAEAAPEDLTADVLMILDTSAWAQLGPMGDTIRQSKAVKIVVDHHVSTDELGAEPFKDIKAEATGRLVIDAAEALGVQLTERIAMPLFAAIATDTGWFRFNSTSSGTYRAAAKLIDAGASPTAIYGALYEQDTIGRLRLRGRVLDRTRLDLDGRLAHTFIRKSDFTETGALASDTEDLVNLTLGVVGTQAAVILVEQLTGGFKISFRSRGSMDCNQVASQFGGGGHKAAAGAFIEGPFETVQAQVLDAVRKAMP
jgi:phosphoesterase RecJ-like protein